MSQLLGRIAKISSVVKKQRLCFSELRSFSTAATPYLLLKETNYRAASGGSVVDINLYDPRKKEIVKIRDQYLSEELQCTMKMGSSRGWIVAKTIYESTLYLTNIVISTTRVPLFRHIRFSICLHWRMMLKLVSPVSLYQPLQTSKTVYWQSSPLVVHSSACGGLVTRLGHASRSRFLPPM